MTSIAERLLAALAAGAILALAMIGAANAAYQPLPW
jgi:hypothetical protein